MPKLSKASMAKREARRLATLEALTARNKKRFLEALAKSVGLVSTAAAATGIGRRTHSEWMAKDKAYREAVDDIAADQVDFVQSKLVQLINGVMVERDTRDGPVVYRQPPDNASVIFYLKTKGKGAGYHERIEINHTGAQVLRPKTLGETEGE